MTIFGAIYYIVPQVTGMEWPLAKAVRAHLWLAAAGILLLAVPLAIGGIVQGGKLNHPAIAPVDVAKATLPFLRASSTGEVLILLGHLLLAFNIIALSVRYYRTHFAPLYAEATAELKPVEVEA